MIYDIRYEFHLIPMVFDIGFLEFRWCIPTVVLQWNVRLNQGFVSRTPLESGYLSF